MEAAGELSNCRVKSVLKSYCPALAPGPAPYSWYTRQSQPARKLCEPDALVHVGWNDQIPCSVLPPRFSPIELVPVSVYRGMYFVEPKYCVTLLDHPSVAGSNTS